MDRDLTHNRTTHNRTTHNRTKEQWGWEMLRQGMLALQEAMAKALAPAFWQLTEAIRTFIIQLQRAQLGISLARRWWIPDQFAHWLSAKWPERWLPERWLPELRFE